MNNPEPINSVSPASPPDKKIPCYEVYDRGKIDCIVFEHSRMEDLQNHIWLLLDSLEAGESIRVEFQPYTQEALDELYDERVGCAPCILSGKEDITRWAQRFPAMIDKLREWEDRTGYQFFQKGGMKVDEVVAWARTDYGGYQFNILKDLDIPSCESKYGLCE